MTAGKGGNTEPDFGDAPKSLAMGGKVVGPLKGKPKGYRGLSKRARSLAIGGFGLAVFLIVIGITSMPDPAETSARVKAEQEAKKAAEVAKHGPDATVPNYVTDAGSGVSTPAGGKEPGTSSDRQTTVPGISGTAGRDPLASAGHGEQGKTGAPSNNGQLSLEEQQAQQDKLARIQALREAQNSEISDANQKLAQQQQALAEATRTGTGVPAIGGAGGPSPAVGQSPQGQDDQNKQLRKEAFLNGTVGMAGAVPSTYLPATVQKPRSPYQVEAGWLIPAMMDSQMNSDLPGTLRAHVSQNVMDSATGRYVLIPGGSRLVGHYDSQVAFGQSRVLVVWDLLKFPDGSELSLLGMQGVDQVGASGLTGDVDNHLWTMMKAAVFMSVITAGAQLSQPQSQQSNGNYQAPSINQTMSAQLGQQLGQVSGNLVSRYLNVQPTITTEPGTRFNILVKQNVVFVQPWAWQ